MQTRDVEQAHSNILSKAMHEDKVVKNKPTDVYQENHPSIAAGEDKKVLTVDFLKKYSKWSNNRYETQ